MDALLKSALNKPSGKSQILFISDGVMKGREVIRAAVNYRAQESIPSMTKRILEETGCVHETHS